MTLAYEEFLSQKRIASPSSGITVNPSTLPEWMFPFQRDGVVWSLAKGRAALFEAPGLGKTGQELVWSQIVSEYTGKPVINIAPLIVAMQTVHEGAKFGISVNLCRSQDDVKPGINVINYEMAHHLDPSIFGGVVLDESGCIKSFDSQTTRDMTDMWSQTGFKLCGTATPSPNDFMELGTHAEFLGIMSRAEMLATFFIHDGGDTSKWRLKGHAEDVFWDWVATWAFMLNLPSDLGYSDEGYILPPLNIHKHIVEVEGVPEIGALFATEAMGLKSQNKERKAHIGARLEKTASIVNGNDLQWVVWCQLNDEADECTALIPGAVQIKGSDTPEQKQGSMQDFIDRKTRVIVTKKLIFAWGANLQNCYNTIYASIDNSQEQTFQSLKRFHRFGQSMPVEAHFVLASTETAILRNLERKDKQASVMSKAMIEAMRRTNLKAIMESDLEHDRILASERDEDEYRRDVFKTKNAELHLGDCVDVWRELHEGSQDYQIFSLPFDSLYTYSKSRRDMGNSARGEFSPHLAFIITELYRTLKPGRLLSFHCMNLPTSKTNDGYIGIRDFRGEMIRMFMDIGFIYHSEVCIWKDPVTAMQRTKALGLLHKQVLKDSCMSRQGIPDFLVTMRKPGVNPDPVSGPFTYFVGEDPAMPKSYESKRITEDEYGNEIVVELGKKETRLSIDIWQRYASPVWMDINPSRTLQYMAARDEKDERHICPLQLDVIERAIHMWSNPGDLVASPFAGIGSELYCAIKMGRRAIGAELKYSYFDVAKKNIQEAETQLAMPTLFDDEDFTA